MHTKKILSGLLALCILTGCSSNETTKHVKVQDLDNKLVVNIPEYGDFEYVYTNKDNSNLLDVIKMANGDKFKYEIKEDGTLELTVKDIPNGATLTLQPMKTVSEELEGNDLKGSWDLIKWLSNVNLETYNAESIRELDIEQLTEIANSEKNDNDRGETLTFYADGSLHSAEEGFTGFKGFYSIKDDGLTYTTSPDAIETGVNFLVNENSLIIFTSKNACKVYQKTNQEQ